MKKANSSKRYIQLLAQQPVCSITQLSLPVLYDGHLLFAQKPTTLRGAFSFRGHFFIKITMFSLTRTEQKFNAQVRATGGGQAGFFTA